jgi:lipopolysaccharide/colanic/teichoic acid biosynthesis glycosyltransferase
MRRFYFIDVLLSAAGLIALSPVLAGIALAILVETGLPIFFRQERVGRNGAPFWLLKFRSMRVSKGGSQITGAHDDRITPVGRFIRRYKLDELPQLWNVLTGEMRLVGPRPEVPRFVDLSDPTWRTVLSVPPGITDVASLVFRNEEELLAGVVDVEAAYRRDILPPKLALNVDYLRRRNRLTDLQLIFLTIWYSVFPRQFNREQIIQKFC